MSKKKNIKVFIHFDNKKYSYQEELLDKVMFFTLLKEMQLKNDYENNKIKESDYNYYLGKCKNITKTINDFKKL